MQLGALTSLIEVGIALNLAFVVVGQLKGYLQSIISTQFEDAKATIGAKLAEAKIGGQVLEAATREANEAVKAYNEATTEVQSSFENFGLIVAAVLFLLLIGIAAFNNFEVSRWFAVALGAVIVTPLGVYCFYLDRRRRVTCTEIKGIAVRYKNAVDGHQLIVTANVTPTPVQQATPAPPGRLLSQPADASGSHAASTTVSTVPPISEDRATSDAPVDSSANGTESGR